MTFRFGNLPQAITVDARSDQIIIEQSGVTKRVLLDAVVPATGVVWRESDVSTTLVSATAPLTGDRMNGIAFTGASAQVLTVPANVLQVGESTLVYQQGAGAVTFLASGGATLRYRSGSFNAKIAGQYGIITLIAKSITEIILCGDLELIIL